MFDRLQFPENAPDQLFRDCEDLRWILIHGVEIHCAWLRAAQEEVGTVEKLTGEWGKDHEAAVLREGIRSALEQGLVDPGALRVLAHDPVLLEGLHNRIFAEGRLDVWLPTGEVASSENTVEEIFDEFFNRLAQVDPKESDVTRTPCLTSNETSRVFPGLPVSLAEGRIWSVEAAVHKEAILSLRLHRKTWGKLQIERASSTLLQVQGATGVFLSIILPTELRVRLAASVPKRTEPVGQAPSISVRATKNGVALDLFVSVGSKSK